MRLVYRPLFLADAADCADYLASEAGETVVAEWNNSLKKAIQHIQKTPEIGHLRRDLPVSGVRSLNLRKFPKYLIFYRLEKDKIELLRIRHGMMHLPELFGQ